MKFHLGKPALKLVCTLLNYHVLGTTTANVFLSNDHSLYAPIYLGWRSCLISFEWDQSTCQERIESDKIQTENIYIVQIAKRRRSPVLAFNMPIPDQVECLVVFAC